MCDYTCVTNRRELSVPVLAFPSKLSKWKGNTNVSCSWAHDLSLTQHVLWFLCSSVLSLSLPSLLRTASRISVRNWKPKKAKIFSPKIYWSNFSKSSLTLSLHYLSLSLFPSRRLVVERHTALWAHALAEDVHCWDVLFLWWEFIVTGVVGGLLVVSLCLSLWASSPSTGCCMGFLVGRSHGASALRFCSTSLALCDQTRINLC